jgi:hypothetical protein
MYFLSVFFDINIYFTTHLIKEIKLLGPMFLHQMYVYEIFNDILKLFIRNRAYPKGSMVQGYYTKEAVEWAINYTDPSNPISVSKSYHEGRRARKGTIGKKAITPDPNYFTTLISMCCNKCPVCSSTWLSTRRYCLEIILGTMNYG